MYRAYEMSPTRHEIDTAADDQPCSKSQDDDLISVGEAAVLLGLSRRSVQRLAADPGGLSAVRIGHTWALRRSVVLALAQQRRQQHHDRPGTQGPTAIRASGLPEGRRRPTEPPNVEAVVLAIDQYLVALSDEEFAALVATGPQRAAAASAAEYTGDESVLMPATTSLRDCSQLVTATLEAGGQAPEVLQNILDGAALLNTRPAPVDPAHTIVTAATDGSLTAEKLDELLVTAASQQSVAGYACELRQRSERMFVEEFHRALKDGACDELLGTIATGLGCARGGRRRSTQRDQQ